MSKSKTAQERPGSEKDAVKAKANGAILLIAALDMSWRLAIVVLVPIVGGFELDKHWGISPALTIVGFLLAMVGVFVILRRTVANANSRFNSNGAHR